MIILEHLRESYIHTKPHLYFTATVKLCTNYLSISSMKGWHQHLHDKMNNYVLFCTKCMQQYWHV